MHDKNNLPRSFQEEERRQEQMAASKKLQQYSMAKREVEEHLVEYCTLREYGFNFANQVVIK